MATIRMVEPRAYVQSLQRSIAHYRQANAAPDYLAYLYGLFYEALDDLWEHQSLSGKR